MNFLSGNHFDSTAFSEFPEIGEDMFDTLIDSFDTIDNADILNLDSIDEFNQTNHRDNFSHDQPSIQTIEPISKPNEDTNTTIISLNEEEKKTNEDQIENDNKKKQIENDSKKKSSQNDSKKKSSQNNSRSKKTTQNRKTRKKRKKEEIPDHLWVKNTIGEEIDLLGDLTKEQYKILTEEQKEQRKLLKNRKNAQISRDRAKNKLKNLEDEVEDLKDMNENLSSELSKTNKENELLKLKLKELEEKNKRYEQEFQEDHVKKSRTHSKANQQNSFINTAKTFFNHYTSLPVDEIVEFQEDSQLLEFNENQSNLNDKKPFDDFFSFNPNDLSFDYKSNSRTQAYSSNNSLGISMMIFLFLFGLFFGSSLKFTSNHDIFRTFPKEIDFNSFNSIQEIDFSAQNIGTRVLNSFNYKTILDQSKANLFQFHSFDNFNSSYSKNRDICPVINIKNALQAINHNDFDSLCNKIISPSCSLNSRSLFCFVGDAFCQQKNSNLLNHLIYFLMKGDQKCRFV